MTNEIYVHDTRWKIFIEEKGLIRRVLRLIDILFIGGGSGFVIHNLSKDKRKFCYGNLCSLQVSYQN